MQAAARFLFKGGVAAGSAGAGAAALTPSRAECRAARTEATVQAPAQGEKGEGWTTTELLPDGNFSFQEVEEAIDILGAHGSEIGESMQEVLAISEGRARPDVGAVESPRESEAESVASLCSEAVIVASPRSEDDIVASSDSEADNNIRSPWPPAADNTQLSVIIEKLLNTRELQAVFANEMNAMPEVAALLRDMDARCENALPEVMATPSLLLPANASEGYEACPVAERNGFEKALAALKKHLTDVGCNLATFFGSITSNLRNIRGSPKSTESTMEADESSRAGEGGEHTGERRAVWKGAIFGLAIAVFVMIVFKRHHVVRLRRA